MRLGERTSTGDAEGEVVATSDPSSVTRQELEEYMRLQIEEHAGNAPLLELLLESGDHLLEVAQHQLVAAVAPVGGNEVLEGFFIDVLRHLGRAALGRVGGPAAEPEDGLPGPRRSSHHHRWCPERRSPG